MMMLMEEKREKTKAELTQIYKSFNQSLIFIKLNEGYQLDERFHLLVSAEIKYIARKHGLRGLSNKIWKQIYVDLIDTDVNDSVKLHLAQGMKYSIREGSLCMELERIFSAVEQNTAADVKSELIWALGYQIKNCYRENSGKAIDKNLLDKIKYITDGNENRASTESLSFLQDQINDQYYIHDNTCSQKLQVQRKLFGHYSRKQVRVTATKTQQKSKMKNKNSQFEASANELSFVNILKSRRKNIELNSIQENIPNEHESDGNDRSIWRNTYEEVSHLYMKMTNGMVIKKEDRDEYLPSKFLGQSKKWLWKISTSSIKSLGIDMMIADIFLDISKKKRLNNNTIDLLMMCIDEIENMAKNVFDDLHWKEIIKGYKSAKNDSFLESYLELDGNSADMSEKQVAEIISRALRKLRYVAISTIHNAANLEPEILTKTRLDHIESFALHSDSNFRTIVVKILQLKTNKPDDLLKIFTMTLQQLEKDQDVEGSMNYIYNKSVDKGLCRQLFDDTTITKLSGLLNKDNLSEKIKLKACETINNYLGLSDSHVLHDDQLNIYAHFLSSRHREDGKVEALKSILLTVEKNQDLPDFMIDVLIENLSKGNSEADNFSILIFKILRKIRNIKDIDKLSGKLLEDWVLVREENDISFEHSSEENSSCPFISSMVAEIFINALKLKTNISDRSVENLAKALDSTDKQTRILAAKALYFASKGHILGNDTLLRLQKHVDSIVFDVSVYSGIAYAQGLEKISSTEHAITYSLIHSLSKVYAFEELQFDGEIFTDIVNSNVLSILQNAAAHHQFEEDIFQIFNHILLMENNYVPKAIEILLKYSTSAFWIPKSTISALENVTTAFEFSKEIFQILENIVRRNGEVSDNLLHFVADNLYSSDDDLLRKKSFDILNKANDNQDISDDLFSILEIERTNYSIGHPSDDTRDALNYLYESTRKGKRLTKSVFQALSRINFNSSSTCNGEILNILLNISENKEDIPLALIDKLLNTFDQKLEQFELISIFENLVQNNKQMPNDFSNKLASGLENPNISDRILWIFLLQGQKGANLREEIIDKIIKKFFTLENPFTIRHYLSYICSITKQIPLENHSSDTFHYTNRSGSSLITISLVQKALAYALKKDDQEIIRKSIGGLKILRSFYQIEFEKDTIDLLLSKIEVISDIDTKADIIELLNCSNLDEYQKATYESILLLDLSDVEFLHELNQYNKPKLLRHHFTRIKSILINNKDLTIQALIVFSKCSNKENISDEILDRIFNLLKKTTSDTCKELCCDIIHEIAKTGKIVKDEIIAFFIDQNEKKRPKKILETIRNNQNIPQELRNKINLQLRIRSAPFFNSEDLRELLNNLQKEFEKKEISDSSIEMLVKCKVSEEWIKDNIELVKESADFCALVLIEDSHTRLRPLIDCLENAILFKIITKNVLDAYKEIIKQKQYNRSVFPNIINIFNDILSHENHSEYHLDIFICIAMSSELIKISDLRHLETNLSSDSDVVRSWAFRGLRAAREKGSYSSVFDKWCVDNMKKLEEKTKIKIDMDLNLFETLSSSKFDDFEKIRNKPKDQWNREILILDIVKRFRMNENERSNFDRIWLCIEQQQEYADGKSTIILQMIQRFVLNNPTFFDELFQAVELLRFINFDNAQKILFGSRNLLYDLKMRCLTNMICERLAEKNHSDEKNIELTSAKMMSKFDFHLSQRILHAISSIHKLREFEKLLDFAEINNIQISDIYVEKRTIPIFRRSLEIKILGRYLQNVDRLKLGILLDKLLDQNWSFEQLDDLFKLSKESNYPNQLQHLMTVLKTLSDYKIPSTSKEQVLEMLRNSPEKWLTEVNKMVIANIFFDRIQERNSEAVVDEFIDQNLHSEHLKNLSKEKLLNWINKVKHPPSGSLFSDKSDPGNSFLFKSPVHSWNESDIHQWAELVKHDVKRENGENFILEALAIIKQGTLLSSKFHLTDAQILSCLVALNENTNKGRLLQVATGEGKSTIISTLAVVHALRGKKVDIITSSPVLAERDSKDKRKFYEMFGFSCSHNSDRAVYLSGPKACYEADIVYGEVAQFQFDTLRTEYAQLKTLGSRKSDIAIVDEVDSMLIDDSSKIARLATTIPGMDQLQIMYHLLWNQLLSSQEKIIQLDNKLYLFYGKAKLKEHRIELEYSDDDGNIKLITDLKSYVTSTENISHIGFRLTKDDAGEKLIKNSLDKYIRSCIEEKIKLPKCFQDFVDKQIPKWIDNAITALVYQENVHYIIHDGLIKPVDYFSTGVVQSSSNWSDGLHQFLQLKHNLRMTSETFTTNFLSNVGFFKKYSSNLLGLSGTLGSERAKQVLETIYKVDLALIPSLRRKQHFSLPDIALANEADWLEEICDSANLESKKQRGILIICETIENCKVIEEQLRRKHRSGVTKLYTMNDMNQEQYIEVVHPGEIIIATNLAGRGTDIKTKEIEEYGGLHVILTFMPANQRVEEQALGRTSRQGNRGTSQKILNATNLIHYECCNNNEIRNCRDIIEKNILDDFEQKELQVINIKDELFVRFCSLLNEIRTKIRQKTGYFTASKNIVKGVFTHVNPSVLESNTLLSVEEQWAMFLREIDDEKSPINNQKLHAKFDKFRDEIIRNFTNNSIIKNPFYHIIIGNDLVISDSSLNSKYNEAMKHFDRAIELDPDHSAAAFNGRGWLLLKGKERMIISNKQELNHKDAAIIQFREALHILIEEIGRLTSIQTFLCNRCPDTNTPLYKQLIQKNNILSTYCGSIQNLIDVIKKSQRLIQIREIIDYSDHERNQEIISYENISKDNGAFLDIRLINSENDKQYETAVNECKEIVIKKDQEEYFLIYSNKKKNQTKTEKVNDFQLKKSLSSLSYDGNILGKEKHAKICNQIYQKIMSCNGCIQGSAIAYFNSAPDGRKYEITFNDLTVRKDTITIDQAEETIDTLARHLSEGQRLDGDLRYRDVRLSLLNVNSDTMKQLFDPNIEIKGVTKEVVLAQLTNESSFSHPHLLSKDWRLDSCLVNVDTISKSECVEMIQSVQVRKAIELIKQKHDPYLLFNLTFLSANDICKNIKKEVINHSRIIVEFVEIDGQDIKNKITRIESESINLKISGRKEQVLEVIESAHVDEIEVYSSRTRQHKYKNIADALNIIQRIAENVIIIELIGISRMDIQKIVDARQDWIFNVSFNNINTQSLSNELNNQLVNVHFEELKVKAAKLLVTQVRKTKVDFRLTFKNLDQSEAKELIDRAPIRAENIEIRKVKRLEEKFMNDLRPDLELSEFSGRGIEYLLEIGEKNFIPWTSVSIVAGIAAVQMTVGAALAITGLGTTLGLGLITEAGADLLIACRVCSTRDFSWSDYGHQKAISITISVASMGISALKNVSKGVNTLVTAIGDEAIEQTATNLITRNSAARRLLVETGKSFRSFTVRQVGTTVGETVLRQGLSKLSNSAVISTFEQMRGKILYSIRDQVNCELLTLDLTILLRKMYALDRVSKMKRFEEKINQLITSTNSKHSSWRRQFSSIGFSLCSTIFQNMREIQRPESFIFATCNILSELRELDTLTQNIVDHLREKIRDEDRETLSLQQIFSFYCSVNDEISQHVVNVLQENGIVNLNEELENENFIDKLNLIDTSALSNDHCRTINFLKSLCDTVNELVTHDFSELVSLVSDVIVDNILLSAESEFVSKWSKIVMSAVKDNISEKLQDYFVPDETSNTITEAQTDEKSEYSTKAKLMETNIKDYVITYSQCENTD